MFSTSRKENAGSNIYGMTAPHEFANPAALNETSMKVCWSMLTKIGHLKMRNYRGNTKYLQLVASFLDHSEILSHTVHAWRKLHSCKIKSGIGLGTRLYNFLFWFFVGFFFWYNLIHRNSSTLKISIHCNLSYCCNCTINLLKSC